MIDELRAYLAWAEDAGLQILAPGATKAPAMKLPMLEEVRQRFGPRVAHVVAGCTDSDTCPKPPWRERKEAYLEHLRTADPDVRLVSAADKLHNAREILRDYRTDGELVWQRFGGRREGTLWYYRALAEEFRRPPGNRLVDELNRVIAELDRLAQRGESAKR